MLQFLEMFQDPLTLKMLALHPIKFRKAQKALNADAIEGGHVWDGCHLTVFVTTPGQFGFNDGIEIVPGFNLYGEC